MANLQSWRGWAGGRSETSPLAVLRSEYSEAEHSRWDGFDHPIYPETGPLRVSLFLLQEKKSSGSLPHDSARPFFQLSPTPSTLSGSPSGTFSTKAPAKASAT